MRKITTVWCICTYQIRRMVMSYKSVLLLMLLCVYALIFATPIADFAARYNHEVNVSALLPVLTSDYMAQMVLMIGVVILFSDAPFVDHNQLYIMMRCERSAWAAGQILYIMAAMIMFIVAMVIIGVGAMLPHVTIDWQWGKIWQTLAHQSYGLQISVSARLVNQYSVAEALEYSLLLTWLAGCFVGLTVFFLNFATNSKVGIVVGGLMSLLNMAIYNSLFSYKLYSISPLSLSNLAVVDRYGMTYGYPTLTYAICVLFIANIVLIFAICKMAKTGNKCLEMNV